MVAWNWNLQIHSKTEIEEFDLHFMVLGLHLPLLLERILIDLYEEVQFGQREGLFVFAPESLHEVALQARFKMSSVIAEHGATREALIFQVLLGISVIGCLFFIQTLVCGDFKILCGAANVVGAGTLSGGLHALSGPDHLAALLPFVLGQKWHKAAYFGSIWGLGHGLTTSLMGVIGFYVKDSLLAYKLLPQLANLADYAVGLTLIIIGVMGIYESRSEGIEEEESSTQEDALLKVEADQRFLTEAVDIDAVNPLSVLLTIFLNGCFLGMSWDGLPSLAPTLALYSWHLLCAFLVAYIAGTVLTISVASGFIGESTKWLSTVTSEDLPRRLALAR